MTKQHRDYTGRITLSITTLIQIARYYTRPMINSEENSNLPRDQGSSQRLMHPRTRYPGQQVTQLPTRKWQGAIHARPPKPHASTRFRTGLREPTDAPRRTRTRAKLKGHANNRTTLQRIHVQDLWHSRLGLEQSARSNRQKRSRNPRGCMREVTNRPRTYTHVTRHSCYPIDGGEKMCSKKYICRYKQQNTIQPQDNDKKT